MNDSDSAWALLALRSAPGSPSRVTWQGNNSPENAIARLEARGFEYLIRQDKIIIGRRTSREKIDVNMGHSAYISRHHLEIHHQSPSFFMRCVSKNGIFVDGMFIRNDAEPIALQKTCTFRFPSTNIKLTFQSLINEEPIDLKMAQVGNFKPPTQSPQPVKDSCDFRSQPQSPADTISAANSCPTSPRPSTKWHTSSRTQPNSPQPQAHHNNNNNNTNNSNNNTGGYVEVIDQNFMDASEVILDTNGNSTVPSGVDSNNHQMLLTGTQSHGVCEKPIFPHEPSTSSHSSNRHSEDGKPPYSYAQLIVQAISAAPDKQLTLNGIYSYITRNYPYYKTADKGWQNSIRHNLSLNRYFVKVPRNQEEPGKGSFWRIETMNETKLLDSAFRRRRKRENSSNSNSQQIDALSRGGDDMMKTPDIMIKPEPEQLKTEVIEESASESCSSSMVPTSLQSGQVRIEGAVAQVLQVEPVSVKYEPQEESIHHSTRPTLESIEERETLESDNANQVAGGEIEPMVEADNIDQIVKEEIVETSQVKDCGDNKL